MDSAGKDTAEEKRQSKLDDEEKHRECRDREMAEEIARDLCEEMLFVNSKVS